MDKELYLQQLFSDMLDWKKDKIITKNQEDKIKDYYKERFQITWTKSNRFIEIVSIIWSVFIWLWVILFFASNWDWFGDVFKTILLIWSVIVAYGIGFYLYYINWEYKKTWYSVIFLWAMFYWASIFLLGQIYNLWWTFYEATLWWLLGILPLIYLTGFSLLLLLGIVLFYIYIFAYLSGFNAFFNERVVLSLISVISLFYIAFWKVHVIERYSKFQIIFNVVWILWLFISTFMMSFEDLLLNNYGENPMLIIYFILWFILATILLSIYHYSMQKKFERKNDLWYIIHAIFIGFVIFMLQSWYLTDKWEIAILVLVNIYFVSMVFYSTYLWVIRHQAFLINISLFFVVIFMIAKYVEWFFGLMEKSLFFIWWWLILLIWWWFLEKRRKALMEKIK